MARKNKKKKTLAFKNAVAGYLFIAPFIIGFILFLVVPLVQSLRMSFSTVELEGGLSMTTRSSEEEPSPVRYSSCRLFFHPVLSLVWKAEIRFWLT